MVAGKATNLFYIYYNLTSVITTKQRLPRANNFFIITPCHILFRFYYKLLPRPLLSLSSLELFGINPESYIKSFGNENAREVGGLLADDFSTFIFVSSKKKVLSPSLIVQYSDCELALL